MVLESACVSSHIQEKEKVAAAVIVSVLLVMFITESQSLSDVSNPSLHLHKMYFCWCECFFVFIYFCLLFWIQQHSHGSTNSTFRKIDLLYSAFSFSIEIHSVLLMPGKSQGRNNSTSHRSIHKKTDPNIEKLL